MVVSKITQSKFCDKHVHRLSLKLQFFSLKQTGFKGKCVQKSNNYSPITDTIKNVIKVQHLSTQHMNSYFQKTKRKKIYIVNNLTHNKEKTIKQHTNWSQMLKNKQHIKRNNIKTAHKSNYSKAEQ